MSFQINIPICVKKYIILFNIKKFMTTLSIVKSAVVSKIFSLKIMFLQKFSQKKKCNQIYFSGMISLKHFIFLHAFFEI